MLLLMATSISALCTPHAVQGKVLYEDGTPAMGAEVTVTHVKTGATVEGTVEWDGGWYAVDLGNLWGSCFSRGDLIEVTATNGKYSGSTTFTVSETHGYNIPDTIYLSRHKKQKIKTNGNPRKNI